MPFGSAQSHIEAVQVPPAYSAISVNGVRAYARAGRELVELDARPVTVHSASLAAIQDVDGRPGWLCAFEVSKGCYIRAIAAHSAGVEAAHCGSQAHELGFIRLLCATLEELERDGAGVLASSALDPAVPPGSRPSAPSPRQIRFLAASTFRSVA